MWKPFLAVGCLLLSACALPTARADKFAPGLTTAQAAQIRFLKSDDSITSNARNRRIERILAR